LKERAREDPSPEFPFNLQEKQPMRRSIATAMLLCLFITGFAFAQGTSGTLTGTVEDASKALIPGVTVTATNTNTGVTNSTVSNESGAYTIPALLQGVYQLKASLPGFQTQTLNNIELGAETKRFNFSMQIAGVTTNVEVSVDASTVLTTTGATVGEVLSSAKVMDLPLVSGDILDLVRIMPGVRISPLGGGFDTFAGMSANTVNTVRDGLSVTDGRYLNGVFASSTINPDLVGEIRLILTPVDAEMGRGNGQVQITTRSGTNRYTGSAQWNVRNTALNANTWDNNNDTTVVNGATVWSPTQPNWSNENQVTVSYGGPILKNKTFFFALFDKNMRNQRTLQTATVMTETAKAGIYRYFDGWSPGNALATIPTLTSTGTTYPSVDLAGNPVIPGRAQGANGGAFTGSLRCVSVFGTRKADGSPFTAADCPGGVAMFPGAGAQAWDSLRPVMDPTGFIAKYLAEMPAANYFGAGDGLNTAGHRWLRGSNANSGGLNTTSLQTGTNINADRDQWNFKVDHNFTSNHKANVGFTWEKSGGADFLTNWPNMLPGETVRKSKILTTNLTSTLSSTLLNEARFGIRTTSTASNAAWQHGVAEISDKAQSFFLQGSKSLFSDDPTPMPALFNPGAGAFAITGGNGALTQLFDTNAVYLGNTNPLYNFADTVRWSHGAHSFRTGGELRITRSNGYNFLPYNLPRLTGGNGNYDAANIARRATTGGVTTGIEGMIAGTEGNARNLLYLMAGSVSSGNVGYWINSPDDVTDGRWEDYITAEKKFRDQRSNEWSAFFQDDWKITRRLTLNLGLRYEYYGAPYLKGGFTSTAIDMGEGLFGMERNADNPFANWMTPGAIFLTGYGGTNGGQTAATMLQCVSGQRQNANLPLSTCDPTRLTTLEFVGPDSPNPNKSAFPSDKNNFGPNVGFSYQLPWFGEGKTTIRGGYSITYGGPGRNGIDLDAILGGAPGATNTANLSPQSFRNPDGTPEYLDLTDVPRLVPITPTLNPGGSFPVYQKSGTFSAYSQDFATPYTQNFNLSVTRTLSRQFTLDLRYVGTRGMKLSATQNLNEVNVFNNPELFNALEQVRRGEEAPYFDQIFAGVNLNPTQAGYGAIGTCVTQAAGSTVPGLGRLGCGPTQVRQTAAAHLRRWQGGDLANGNYLNVAEDLNGSGPGGANLLVGVPTGTSVGGRLMRNGCDRLALGTPIGGAPAGQVQTANGLMPIRCMPENYLTMNPQLGTADYVMNTGNSNYHSLQTQVIMRPIAGFSLTGTYTWSKTMTLPGDDNISLLDRKADYTLSGNHLTHDFRTNGTIELPLGPNKLLFGNASGWFARALERWQASFIFNAYSGRPVSIIGTQTLWGGAGCPPGTACGNPDIVGPLPIRDGEVEWGTITINNIGNTGGTFFGSPSPFAKVADPVCAPGGLTDRTDAMGWNLRGNVGTNGQFTALCTLDAVARASTGQILLQNAQPGKRGTLGTNTMSTRGVWSFDGNVSKSFRIDESKSIQLRMDATNILNHPTPADPTLNINSDTDFGEIRGDKTGNRTFRGSMRITF
jgi:hypothetical protein